MSDIVLDYMKRKRVKLTRKNYLDLDFFEDAPEEPLDPEIEIEIPDEVKSKVIPIDRKKGNRER
jgi:hypothetical protein